MKALRGVLPHPALSLSLAVIWLALNGTMAPGHVLLGAALGVGLPVLARAYWPERPPFHRLPLLWRLFFQVNWDILVASVTVARLTLTRRSSTLEPQFVAIPVECQDVYAQILLVSIVTITPGTLVADFDHEHGLILVHFLHEPDPGPAARQIKTRYERPLKEILG